ncbi:LOW QUALITY PROTEIN: hypothetical protein Cgig2_013333 [Carnegiea gigantea]|uniref:Aminotransferase-like plant mobile domain-containing protein n=1 Tax=Carnegiea gigantea TaxID=171969 RepID=A0A9Q1GUS9_9CARY|nr:LOW QUALITY PROTEIN: hypothetical protein Cgig2_013333 [Carnegiea gigantea]
MEWVVYILTEFKGKLKQPGIFGAVGVSQFPYHFNCDVWRAFCELWGPLTITLHHGVGEIGICLYDIERISGLSVISDVYEEFLPCNDLLCDPTKYPPTVAELLRIHAELCQFYKCDYVFCNKRELALVTREYEGEWPKSKKNSPPQVSLTPCIVTLNVTREGELAAFIAFWLSHFVLPHGRDVIRLKTFMMAALLVEGQRFSLAPMVLGYIYHGLGQPTSHPAHPGEAGATLPIHYVAELFPHWYSRHPDCKCPKEYPVLIHYAGYTHANFSLSQARHIFRDEQFAYLWASTFPEDSQNSRDRIDMGLSDDDFRYLLFIRSSVFPSLIDIYKLSTIEIYWLSSKIEEIFEIVESVVQIEGSADIDRVNTLSDRDLTCSSEMILKEEERIQKILIEAERKLKSTLDLKKKEAKYVKADLDLEKEKDHLHNLIGPVISFNNV